MKAAVVLLLTLLGTQVPAQAPKNNPNGIWAVEAGSKFELRLSGSDLKVQIVPDSNPRFLEYDVNLKLQDELNSYKGTGSFLAKLSTGKECRFDTAWNIIVVAPDRILGTTTNVVPNGETCEVLERGEMAIELRRVE